MAIPAIGIVAVLVANVTFVAWVTPPGMPISAVELLQCHSMHFIRTPHA